MSKLSIVTPVFNSMRTLQEYIQAIENQKLDGWQLELIFADGGSTDGTLQKLSEYQQSPNFEIEVCSNPLRTAEAGKAVGVRQATGDQL